MINQSRRTILKSLGYGIAVSASGLASSAAMALTPTMGNKDINTSLPSCDITIYQHQSTGTETVTLMNLSHKPVTLDSITPVGLEHVNGSLVVKINQAADGAVTLQPGERLSFEIEARTHFNSNNKDNNDDLQIPNVLAGHLRVKSDHPAFNGIIPVTVFDGQIA